MSFSSFPAHILPSECSIRLLDNTKRMSSSFNRASQRVSFGGEMWVGSLLFSNLPRSVAGELTGFLWSLQGGQPFWLGDSGYGEPRGLALGSPVVNGSGQTGRLLSVRGCQPNTLFLRAGDYLQVGTCLLGCRQDVTANAAGQCQIPIIPRLREIPADGAPVIVRNAKGLFCLQADETPGRSTRGRAVVTTIQIEVIEYL